ncbi:MAG: PEGA domain-containing protein [Bacteroidetes bacterium]|jgi:hypothetical protein|nr:PEGA domain-containing protein [Bacteroidota bacterium]MBT5529239.1 PEGA domain-containing protein [Cytophagia bacterium]MBT3424388.1 PEGA domain-containing protein [Bacteroidota bacterium]MBT3802723.1 PEGA domain-containing protein [Bacteroidota bacterium]MBT3932791.1 PEGA domain-containing protein [Bacteroidota bacterium]
MKSKSNIINPFAILVAALIVLSSCSSTTLIETDPAGAIVYIDGVNKGQSPVRMTNSKIISSCTDIRIEKEGYERLYDEICREEEPAAGPIVCGYFFLVPLLWAFDYNPSHFYELTPLPLKPDSEGMKPETMEEKLLRFKALFEKGLITEEEYKKAKEKILNE